MMETVNLENRPGRCEGKGWIKRGRDEEMGGKMSKSTDLKDKET